MNSLIGPEAVLHDARTHRTWYRRRPKPVVRVNAHDLSRRLARDRGLTIDDALTYMESCRNQGEAIAIEDELYEDRPPPVAA